MQPNEKTNDKANLQANQQPKKTWQEPVLTNLELNSGNIFFKYESDSGTVSNPPSGVY
jgi:hypothetical protein